MPRIKDYKFSYRQKNGGWQIILSFKVGKKWKQKSKQGFPTKRAANEAKSALLDEARKASLIDPTAREMTFRRFAVDYYAAEHQGRWEDSTRKMFMVAIAHFPNLLDKRLDKIRFIDIMDGIRLLQENGNKPQTINNYITRIKAVFKSAVSPHHLISENPAADVQKLKVEKAVKPKAMTEEQLSGLLDFLHSRDLCSYTMATIAGCNGLRSSEIGGLTWNDIDFIHKTITVNKQVDIMRPKRMKRTKTQNSIRTIPASTRTLSALAEYRAASPISISGEIFPGFMYRRNRLFRLIKEYDGNFNIHALRHTFATIMLKNGADIQTVAALLGDTPAIVMKTYIHYTDDLREKAKKVLETAFLA